MFRRRLASARGLPDGVQSAPSVEKQEPDDTPRIRASSRNAKVRGGEEVAPRPWARCDRSARIRRPLQRGRKRRRNSNTPYSWPPSATTCYRGVVRSRGDPLSTTERR